MRPSKQSRQLAGAVAEEQQRHAVDAAKKRAVAQHADYDTFKKLVSVAHLKPLQAPPVPSAISGLVLPAWRLDPGQLPAAPGAPGCLDPPNGGPAAPARVAHEPVLPRNSQEFAREWRRRPTPAAKYRLLKQCAAALPLIFRVEINAQLLGQLLQVLQQVWASEAEPPAADVGSTSQPASAAAAAPPASSSSSQQQQQQPQQQPQPQQQQEQPQVGNEVVPGHERLAQEAATVVCMLHSLTTAGRFDLNVQLLDAASKRAAAALCEELRDALQAASGSTMAGKDAAGPRAALDQLQHVRQALRLVR